VRGVAGGGVEGLRSIAVNEDRAVMVRGGVGPGGSRESDCCSISNNTWVVPYRVHVVKQPRPWLRANVKRVARCHLACCRMAADTSNDPSPFFD
jgi:hypothetical protein